MKSSTLSHTLLHHTEGVAQTMTDTLLFCFYVFGSSFFKRGSRGVYESFKEADIALSEVNYQSIKRAITSLKTKENIPRSFKKISPKNTQHLISTATQRFKVYHPKRPWNSHIYVISYDIPSRQRYKRDMFRSFLRSIACAPLQESLFINPYNPTERIKAFAEEKNIQGSILISKLGKDGAIGEESLQELIYRVYKLNTLSERYSRFIETYTQGNAQTNPLTLAFAFQSIVKEDPQIPFELMPRNFPSQRAFTLYSTHIRKYTRT